MVETLEELQNKAKNSESVQKQLAKMRKLREENKPFDLLEVE